MTETRFDRALRLADLVMSVEDRKRELIEAYEGHMDAGAPDEVMQAAEQYTEAIGLLGDMLEDGLDPFEPSHPCSQRPTDSDSLTTCADSRDTR